VVGAVVPRLRLRIDSGIAVAARTIDDPALIELGRDVVRTIGLGWVANVQVRADRKGRPRLLEVNPRFPGSMPLTIEAGVDMPRVCLAMALGSPMPSIGRFREVAMVRYLDDRFLDVAELATVPRAARPGQVPVP
jgi:carbamoyl-phosphate synthase large subunit